MGEMCVEDVADWTCRTVGRDGEEEAMGSVCERE